MTPLVKSLVGIGLAGGGTGLAVGGYYLFKESEPKTLSEKFRNKGIKVLDLSSTSSGSGSDAWDQKLTKYNSTDQAQNRFSGLPSANESSAQKQQLINECKKHLGESLKEISKTPELEKKVELWCTEAKP